ncbi:heme-dependent catalase [Aspergillus saccharolyticus JOP 1030-1]|uniref:Catalase n=1 Tax=Aspergillus saccharolyticus JOP 1030-1 TaxID=1450539 RepID=A0A318ZD16_9EURO|nr:heme-dependent catalase [Aspergillus saccharolyticus JOP 1030-1]PYH42543.1 heme-dependent catalase [Aspergillus saccharolyticus JOP 1030-1]
MRPLWLLPAVAGLAGAQCPFLSGEMGTPSRFTERADNPTDTIEVVEQPIDQTLYLNDTDSYMTTDFGTPIEDQWSLKAGSRGSTLLEDFIFRQKLQRFDHERIPERVVHARGAGAYGTFRSYGNFSNVTAADFLSAADKETPMFCRFSTVVGFRGSVDTARDVHGHACRFYTDEGNYDIVGVNIAPFFIQDAIQFPDLVHAIKPMPHNEIPQAATAHTSAWDFFSQQSTALHSALWLMSGHGIPRSYRHMNGYGVHSFRFVTANGTSKVIRYRWRSLQGVASLVWDEAQATAGKNSDFHRQDLHDAIANGRYPKWELGAQIMDESDMLRFGFDLLDPTKMVPEELVPFTPLGVMELNANPTNYFAEVEQVGFQPGHVVRGIDFTEDPLLQGRLFSYLDTQVNRHGGPNFEQLPVNRPRNPVHNNNRDGFGQQQIPLNPWAYTPTSMGADTAPKQANQTVGNGFFTSPYRHLTGGPLSRAPSPTFADHWSQPALFWNSLVPAEQQMLVNAIVFENSKVASPHVRQNVVAQLNRIDHGLARRVARGLGLEVPEPEDTYYTTNKTVNVGTFGARLLSVEGLQVGFLASTKKGESIRQGGALAGRLAAHGVDVTVVAETYADGVNSTYALSDASGFDAIVVGDGVEILFGGAAGSNATMTTLYPPGRPLQILADAFKYGKPVGAIGSGQRALRSAGIEMGRDGVYVAANVTEGLAKEVLDGLYTFRFLDRFVLDDQ